jgi:hypothetical protein
MTERGVPGQLIAAGLAKVRTKMTTNKSRTAASRGGNVTELVDRVILHPTTREIFRVRAADDIFGREVSFHRHETDAVEIANRRASYG